jgi:hypothetical protein
MNVAALLQETPSEDVSARRARSGSTAAGNNPGQAGPPPPLSQPSPLDRERERERERDRDVWGRGRPTPPPHPPPSNAGLRSLVHSPVDPRSNPPDSYRTGPPPHIQSSPSSSILGRGQPPLSPAPSLKDSKIPVTTSPSSSRASGPQAYGGPHGHPHSSHPSPAMGSLRPNAALASGASQTSVNSGIGGGEAATGWPGPGYGGPGRERRGSASSGIGVGGGLLRSSESSSLCIINHTLNHSADQPHPHHSSHSPVFDKEYHQQQPGARRKTISSASGPLGGSATNSNIMPPPSQLVGPGTGTPPGTCSISSLLYGFLRNAVFFATA